MPVQRPLLCASGRDVTLTSLRAEPAEWIRRAREGEEVVVTERGRPVARLSGVSTTPLLDDLVVEQGH